MLTASGVRHQPVFAAPPTLEPQILRAMAQCAASIRNGGKLMFCGNGGSAGDAQNLAAELVGRLVWDRRELPGLAPSTESSALTCLGNDFGFNEVFSRQVEGLGRAGDVLIAISTAGNSPNVLRAVEVARPAGIFVIGLLGRDGGKLGPLVDLPVVVPSDETARIQEARIFIGHVLCAGNEKALGVVGWDSEG
ncbi:MAG: SIS domain-containing protein [Betaproteobacteria bacterium]